MLATCALPILRPLALFLRCPTHIGPGTQRHVLTSVATAVVQMLRGVRGSTPRCPQNAQAESELDALGPL